MNTVFDVKKDLKNSTIYIQYDAWYKIKYIAVSVDNLIENC